jgi:CRP-like cAMP-binding protein
MGCGASKVHAISRSQPESSVTGIGTVDSHPPATLSMGGGGSASHLAQVPSTRASVTSAAVIGLSSGTQSRTFPDSAASSAPKARKGSVEGVVPSKKTGQGDVNVAAALRSKRRGQIMEQSVAVDLRFRKPVIDKPPEVREMLAVALKNNVLTASLGADTIRDLLNAMRSSDLEPGTVVITQGDEGDNFYVVERGKFDILVDGAKVAVFGDGTPNKSFGELALLYNSPRAATVVARTMARVWWIDRTTFRGIVAVSSHDEHARLKSSLRTGIFADLDVEQFERIAAAATRVQFHDGDQIIRKGDVGEVFYIIDKGSVLCTNIGGGQSDNILSSGDYFGERALVKAEPRAADVFAVGETELIAVHRDDLEGVLGTVRDMLEHNIGMRLLLCVPFISRLPDEQKAMLFGALKLVQYRAGKTIVKAGKELSRFYIVKEGTAEVHTHSSDPSVQPRPPVTMLPGQWFGEAELLDGVPATASVVACSVVQCFELPRDIFLEVLGPVVKASSKKTPIMEKRTLTGLEAAAQAEAKHRAATRTSIAMSPSRGSSVTGASATAGALDGSDDGARRSRRASRRSLQSKRAMLHIAFSDLKQMRTLGTGTFGRVRLVHDVASDEVFALKALQKAQIVAMKQVNNVIREKEILSMVDHPFIIRLYQTFKDKDRLYMLLELVQGGELFSRLQNSSHRGVEGILSEGDTRFYSACVIDALEHLHMRNIAYRDLKPENLLIDSKGYIKIVDFGFAKIVRDRTYTLCGTPEYLAPELITGKGHNKAVDYWAFGVLLFEMVSGYSPFADRERDDQMVVARNIMRADVVFPKWAPYPDLRDLVARLLNRDASKRLGMLKSGAADVKGHPFFESVKWEDLREFRVKAPWIPKIKGKFDVGCFDEYSEDEELVGYDSGGDDWDRDF